MRIPVIRGVIDRRILVNYRVDPEALPPYSKQNVPHALSLTGLGGAPAPDISVSLQQHGTGSKSMGWEHYANELPRRQEWLQSAGTCDQHSGDCGNAASAAGSRAMLSAFRAILITQQPMCRIRNPRKFSPGALCVGGTVRTKPSPLQPKLRGPGEGFASGFATHVMFPGLVLGDA